MPPAIDFKINIIKIPETAALDGFFCVRANPYAPDFPEIIKRLFHNSFSPTYALFLEISIDRRFSRLRTRRRPDAFLYILPRFASPPRLAYIYVIHPY